MKAKFYSYILFSALLTTICVTSCDKSIEFTEQLTPLNPSNLDADAATWSMVLMTSPDQIAVPAPTDVTSDAYKAELTAIKDAQSKLTKGTTKDHRLLEWRRCIAMESDF